ncbi:MAG TPA: hypothetical protein VMS45_07040 [Gemmatimonadaceae bacterium]|nr:hypothetical protein [Gemmatimonadaceae bacterium]
MLRPTLRVAAASAVLAPLVAAQVIDVPLYVRHGGGGGASSLLSDVLEKPYVMRYHLWNTVLRADSTFSSTVVVLNSDATVYGTVQGDVVVINGSINLTSTTHITGRALAFGGNVYSADSARVDGRREAFPAAHFDTVRTERGLALDYRGPPPPPWEYIQFAGIYGFTVPLYDRVDGLSVGWYPSLVLRDSVFMLSPGITYRSNLGVFDGNVTARAQVGGAFMSVSAARLTRTNDAWIQDDFPNSFMVLCCGKDFRNYWRADFGEARVGYKWNDTAFVMTFWLGGRTEKASSVPAGGPWGITGTSSVNSMYRPNPAIEPGTIKSGLAGIDVRLGRGDHPIDFTVMAENAFSTPDGSHFTQFTASLDGSRHIARDQDLLFRGQLVGTTGDTAPPQRYAYLGGSGTVPTLGLLQFGGDHLAFFEADYSYTMSWIDIPFTTSPTLALAYTAGSAGIGGYPTMTQNIGTRFAIKPLRWDLFYDPRSGQWRSVVLLWFVR